MYKNSGIPSEFRFDDFSSARFHIFFQPKIWNSSRSGSMLPMGVPEIENKN
jgi:hypothetical protein